ncbi:MAG: NAD(P)/FAD-dependent oxidoreductase [Aquabacterium sp.]|nr:NAD(P)/FAD-dependent oxidoreductase [Aquabacterium sp.]
MSLGTWLKGYFGRRMAEGLFVRLRQTYPRLLPTVRSLGRAPVAQAVPFERSQHIVVVGNGPAGLACLQALHDHGFDNVTNVSKGGMFGGKCVNFGCMPMEYVLSRPADLSTIEVREGLASFVASLRAKVAQQMTSRGDKLLHGGVREVSGRNLVFDSGETLPFDRLILATGSRYEVPRVLQGNPKLCSLESFWTLPEGSRVAIVADQNPAAIAVGLAAARLGLRPAVMLQGNALASLPSFKYYLRQAQRAGLVVHESFRVLGGTQNELFGVAKGAADVWADIDHIVVLGRPVPDVPSVDGRLPELFELDLRRACHPARPDIFLVGDAVGLMTVSEAELHAEALIAGWFGSARFDLRELSRLPVLFHGEVSLGMVGNEWAFLTGRWREIDFRALAWTDVHREEGKLWYQFDADSGKVTAIHICHPRASELIIVASALMGNPVTDMSWRQKVAHPSPFEIFRLLAQQLQREVEAREGALPKYGQLGGHASSIQRPSHLHISIDTCAVLDSKLPSWLGEAQWQRAVLSTQPLRALSLYAAVVQLLDGASQQESVALREVWDQPLKDNYETMALREQRSGNHRYKFAFGDRSVEVSCI